jgi:hypothetical protein
MDLCTRFFGANEIRKKFKHIKQAGFLLFFFSFFFLGDEAKLVIIHYTI